MLAFPDVLRAVLPRFLDPHGDHPPYSRVRITAEPGDTEVLYGGQCEIRARTDGPPVEKLALVVTRNGQANRSVMFAAPDRSFFQTVVNIREETEYYVTDGRARTYRHRIRVKLTPRITRLELRAEFPSYTGRPATVEQLKGDALAEPMDKRLPRGTRLSFRVRSNRPLASGTLELTPILGGKKTVVTLERTGDCTVAGSFALAEPVVFTLGVTDTDGIASTAPRHGRVTLLPDRTPRVTVLQPGKHAVATPDVAIPVLVRAEDDYAVTRLIWYRGHNR
jgi:hypothetical protein